MRIKKFQQKLKWFFLFWLLVCVVFNTTSMVAAQGDLPSDDEVNRIASQLYCPICDNVPLDVCPLEACREWRELIRQQLADGWSERDIKAYFVAQYGDRVLGEPPRSGLNWVLYLLPPLIVVLGFIMLFSKMKRPAQQDPIREHRSADPYLEQVERDLKNQE